MRKPYEDEQRLYLVAEMQRPNEVPRAMPNMTFWCWVAVWSSALTFWVCLVKLIVYLWRCCR